MSMKYINDKTVYLYSDIHITWTCVTGRNVFSEVYGFCEKVLVLSAIFKLRSTVRLTVFLLQLLYMCLGGSSDQGNPF